MIKVDLHTHSTGSPDGGIKPEQYQKAIEKGLLDCVAVTDHDSIETALALHKSLGEQIIVGQEITTTKGELIGLFLTKSVPAGQSPLATAKAIKAQGGLVYVPHPFETVRKGLTKASLQTIAGLADIVEVHNGRAFFQNKGPQALSWARLEHKVAAASSDAHGAKGLGGTYSLLSEIPSTKTLVNLLSSARLATKRPPLQSLLYPKANRLKKKLGGGK